MSGEDDCSGSPIYLWCHGSLLRGPDHRIGRWDGRWDGSRYRRHRVGKTILWPSSKHQRNKLVEAHVHSPFRDVHPYTLTMVL